MTSPAPAKTVNLTHRDSGHIVTVRLTQDLLVEPVAGFDGDFPWAWHQAAVEAALLAGDHSVFEPLPTA